MYICIYIYLFIVRAPHLARDLGSHVLPSCFTTRSTYHTPMHPAGCAGNVLGMCKMTLFIIVFVCWWVGCIVVFWCVCVCAFYWLLCVVLWCGLCLCVVCCCVCFLLCVCVLCCVVLCLCVCACV